jgi:serine/threonine protein kinase
VRCREGVRERADVWAKVVSRGRLQSRLRVAVSAETLRRTQPWQRSLTVRDCKCRCSERAAADLCGVIVSVVHRCHSLGVFPRDLKSENFFWTSKAEDAPLKVTDFGLLTFFKPGELFQDIVGSAYYVVPEVLKRSYGPEADVWYARRGA